MTPTAEQALEALNTLADAAVEILWTEKCLELAKLVRQHIEATAAELANERARGIHTCGPDCTRSGCVNARLRAELESLRKDAARYRKLRAGKARTTGSPRAGRIEVFRWDDRMAGTQLKGEELDDAIDAALNQGGAG